MFTTSRHVQRLLTLCLFLLLQASAAAQPPAVKSAPASKKPARDLTILFKQHWTNRVMSFRKENNQKYTEKNVILYIHAGINRNIILDFDIVPERGAAVDVHILPDDTTLSNLCSFHDMGEVPDLRAFANLSTLIDVSGFMHEILRLGFRLYVWYGEVNSSSRKCALAGIKDPQDPQSFGAIRHR